MLERSIDTGRIARTEFERVIEVEVGESIESIRNTPIDERRRAVEKKFGKPMQITNACCGFRLLNREEIEKMLDEDLS